MKNWTDGIRVIDQFLPTEVYEQVVKYLKQPETVTSWGFQMSIKRPETKHPSTFNCHIVKKDNEFFYSTLMDYLSRCFNFEVKPLRIYFNAHVPLSHGSFHTDDGDYTALLYVPTHTDERYDINWGGETQFTNDEPYPNNDTVFVSPWENRLCIFPAKVLHRGLAYLHQDHPIRFTLAFKLERVKKSHVYNLQSKRQ
ncbi:hypothetical protein S820908_053 [Synechococcus phage S-CAM9]|uniref:Fe2OG dioxygenase domain-containing protein n=1 Tax=Synechococcus phage S-CAM9 TaxID=1883369 RepID=A0A1D8KPQ4_9CAUD|nr:DNA endonuclease V [Synechococcus phage S-CAM9]AOV60201.1 hypothetical protein S050808_054 [Synechococcus phage S-CAM9]AOV60428.1 hypothetical protein S820908_053 [Synechococcus phage S-CAM9]AOV60656.1 hypothetical protein N161109_053 [Synechococcus phage S-CAM9]